MSDPFAAAQVAPSTPDAFQANVDSDDPFATSSDYAGGDFTPSPGLENLKGRTVIMIPRKFDPNAKDPNDPNGQKTRELYTVDLVVLNGGELRYYYNQKADPSATPPREAAVLEYVVEDVSPDKPFTVSGFWVPQGAVIGKLKKAHKEGRPFLGVPAMVPVKADRERGVTPAQVEKTVADWVARGRQGNRPRYSWVLDDGPTSNMDRAAAVKWWAANREHIPAITPA